MLDTSANVYRSIVLLFLDGSESRLILKFTCATYHSWRSVGQGSRVANSEVKWVMTLYLFTHLKISRNKVIGRIVHISPQFWYYTNHYKAEPTSAVNKSLAGNFVAVQNPTYYKDQCEEFHGGEERNPRISNATARRLICKPMNTKILWALFVQT
jgi:hypothetical protein